MIPLAVDTETKLIGPGQLPPDLICVSAAWRKPDGTLQRLLTGNGDPCLRDDIEMLLRAPLENEGVVLVFHNAPFDLGVIVKAFPDLEPLVWDLLEQRKISDTGHRQRLLNISTFGKVDKVKRPDGSTLDIRYRLADLVLQHLGIDMEDDKGEDGVQTQFEAMDGLPAAHYGPAFKTYAMEDAQFTLEVWEAQAALVKSDAGYASLSTEWLHVAADVCLYSMTIAGMAVDEERWWTIHKMLEEELAPDRMQPLVDAGLLIPAQPEAIYANQMKKAAKLMASWGIDPDTVDPLEPELRARLEENGIKYKAATDEVGPRKPLLERVVKVQLCMHNDTTLQDYEGLELHQLDELAQRDGILLKRTKTKAICADEEVITKLAPHDPVLEVYQTRQKLQKLVSTELPRMTWPRVGKNQKGLHPDFKIAKRVHFNFGVLKNTGRTSSFASDKYPSGNGQQIDPRARGCYVADPGTLICSVDYSQLELACFAQTTYDILGHSVHRDKINAGVDLHAFLGSQLAVHLSGGFCNEAFGAGVNVQDPDESNAYFLTLKQDNPEFYGHWRKFAKPVGLGKPGQMGDWRFVETALKDYNVNLVKIAKDMNLEPAQHLLYHGRKLYGWESMDDFHWTPILKALALANKLDRIWHQTYPEAQEYFDWVRRESLDPDNTTIGQRLDGSDIPGYAYQTPLGMYRAACTYSEACNGLALQSPAAEGAKLALWEVTRQCRDARRGSLLYGCTPIDFVHDELLTLVPEERASECAFAIGAVMVEQMNRVITDVAVRTEPVLMRRWSKEAEQVFDGDILIPWEHPDDIAAAA